MEVGLILARRVGRRSTLECWICVWRTIVAEDGGWERIVGSAADWVRKGDIEPVVANGLTGINRHVVSLANAKEERVRRESVDWHEVGSNDGHGVIIERNREGILDRRIDNAKEMSLVGSEPNFVIASTCAVRIDVRAIEENIVACWRGPGRVGNEWIVTIVYAKLNLVRSSVVPVCNGENAEVDIVW